MKAEISQHTATSDLSGPRYWRSLDELADTPEFRNWMEREFPAGASEIEGVNRRHFLKIMAASFAMAGAGMAGCRRPEQHILPYSKQPERIVPGNPVYYASSLPGGAENIPLVVETHQARPTKIEGNDRYELYGGGTGLQAQASVLDLYDPDRATRSYQGTKAMTKAQVRDLFARIHSEYKRTGGQGLALLTTPASSPTRARLIKELKRALPSAVIAEYEPLGPGSVDTAAEGIFGAPMRALPQFSKAKRILSLDADFLNREPGNLANSRGFSSTRRVHSSDEAHKMSRLYMVESLYSMTGGMADHRLRVAASKVPAFAAFVLAEALHQTGQDTAWADSLRQQAHGLEDYQKGVHECVKDLLAHRGESLVVAGSQLPPEVHALVYYLNELIGANGKTIRYVERPANEASSLSALVSRINDGGIDTLVVLGGNPAYDAPADLKWGETQKKVKEVVRHSYYVDETALLSIEQKGYTIAGTHYLESWDDGRTFDGTYLPVQPMIMPLFDGFQENEIIAMLANLGETDPYALVRATFDGITDASDKQHAFNGFLNDGLLKGSEFAQSGNRPGPAQVKNFVGSYRFSIPEYSAEKPEVRLILDEKVLDGRYNNNGWLQECPNPMTKLTWDNAILISPKMAVEHGYDPKTKRVLAISAKKINEFKRGAEIAPVATVTIGDTTVTGPVQIQPGLPDWTIVLPLGYGRRKVGRVGTKTGFDAYPLLTSENKPARTGATFAFIDETSRLANTQEHWSMEGRAIIREGNASQYEDNPDFVSEMGMESHSPAIYGKSEDKSLAYKVTEQPRGNSVYKTPTFTEPPHNVDVWKDEEAKEKHFVPPQQWGMSIDLNTCMGCQACVVACQSENNIPIVGKEQVIRGREMHWMRIDRYYSTGSVEDNKKEIPEDPQVSLMPMLCQHCETAPCEQVCPVNATVHDRSGLNVMAYNRCVGTRYCANNCPYKVRRFNFFDWNKREIGHYYEGPLGPNRYEGTDMERLPQMQKNPDVTVRMRGVMEKCTYCQQRIEGAKIAQKVKAKDSNNVHVPDGVIKTACQQVCPTGAIEFGDVSDKDSQVYKIKESDRNYGVLGYLNTRPRTTYLARLRNPNPAMPDYHSMPLSQAEYKEKAGTGHGDGHNGHEGGEPHGESHGHEAPAAHGDEHHG